MLAAKVFALSQCIVLNCVRRPRHATRVAVIGGALREKTPVAATLVLRTRARQPLLQIHRTKIFVVILRLTMMASVHLLRFEVFAFHNTHLVHSARCSTALEP